MIGRDLLRRWSREPRSFAITPQVAARSHVGKVREINEDRFLVRSDQGLWAVADGMGGLAGGSEAAEAAIAELAATTDHGEPVTEKAILAAFDRTNRKIRGDLGDKEARSGTTIVTAWLEGTRLTVFWIGDSRVYLIRRGSARCLTHDHSVVQDLIDAGEITLAEAARHPFAHLVTRALGAAQNVKADKVTIDLAVGDRLLLCSDGISRSLDTEEAAGSDASLTLLADTLLDSALRRDGSDNATLVAIEILAGSPPGPDAAPATVPAAS